MYINDLPNCLLSSRSRMYADDTHLTFSSNDITAIDEALNQDLDLVNNRLVSNKLTLNANETEFMVIGSRQCLNTFPRPPHLTIGDVPINQVSTAKSLGVYMDENLSWSFRTESCLWYGTLKRIRSFVTPQTLRVIFNALVGPHFDYCSVVWGNCNMTLSNKLQELQNRAARILTFSSSDANVEHLFSKLGWTKLSTQHKMQKVIMVFKSLNGLTPEYLIKLFVSRSDITEYLLRDSVNKLAVPLPCTNFFFLKKTALAIVVRYFEIAYLLICGRQNL